MDDARRTTHAGHWAITKAHHEHFVLRWAKNPQDPVRLEPKTPGLRVKHFTTEPRRTPVKFWTCSKLKTGRNRHHRTLPDKELIHQERNEHKTDMNGWNDFLSVTCPSTRCDQGLTLYQKANFWPQPNWKRLQIKCC